jgi:hypothetical protein
LVPEHEILERIEPMLTKELEKKLGSPPPIVIIEQAIKVPPPKSSAFDLQQRIGNQIASSSFPSQRTVAQSIAHNIRGTLEKEYNAVGKLYKESRTANSTVSTAHPKMINDLEELVQNIDLAKEPSNVQKDIRKIAKKYIADGSIRQKGNIVSYRNIGNDSIIAQIESNNQKVKHDYLQGQPSNAYLHLNKILEQAIESTESINPEAFAKFNQARSAYREWAEVAKSPEMLKWRDPSLVDYTKLLKSIENPDQLLTIQPVLNRTKSGQELYKRLQRDYIEKTLTPYLENPKKMDSLDFTKKMREFKEVLTPEQNARIDGILFDAREEARNYERLKEVYAESKKEHAHLVSSQSNQFAEWRKKASDISKAFPYKSDRSILSDMESARGLKRLESHLPQTAEGHAMMDQIKDYAAVNLLTQGKINPSAQSQSLKKILNDVNQRALLEHTLGKSVTNDLREIVNNVAKIDKNLSKMHQSMRLVKNMGKLVPFVRGPIATGEALYDTWSILRPAIEKAEYGLVDMDTIRMLIEHRKDLLQ